MITGGTREFHAGLKIRNCRPGFPPNITRGMRYAQIGMADENGDIQEKDGRKRIQEGRYVREEQVQ